MLDQVLNFLGLTRTGSLVDNAARDSSSATSSSNSKTPSHTQPANFSQWCMSILNHFRLLQFRTFTHHSPLFYTSQSILTHFDSALFYSTPSFVTHDIEHWIQCSYTRTAAQSRTIPLSPLVPYIFFTILSSPERNLCTAQSLPCASIHILFPNPHST